MKLIKWLGALALALSGRCWKLVTLTLPTILTSVPSSVLTPYGAPPTGSTVMVVGRQ